MNVYDFDKTIFYPDSTAAFIRWELKRRPRLILPTLPGDIALGVGFFLGIVSADRLKEQLYSFLPRVEDIAAEVNAFWEGHFASVERWYIKNRREDDVIISAGPEFLHRPVANKLGFTLIGTRLDERTGRLSGGNCHGAEKVRRFRERFPDARIENFYSDSLRDTPMAMEAERAFLVRRGRLSAWPGK